MSTSRIVRLQLLLRTVGRTNWMRNPPRRHAPASFQKGARPTNARGIACFRTDNACAVQVAHQPTVDWFDAEGWCQFVFLAVASARASTNSTMLRCSARSGIRANAFTRRNE